MALRTYEAAALAQNLPDYTLVHSYHAGVPVYECLLDIRVMAAQDMSALQMTVLQCIGAGIDTPAGIDLLLGCGYTPAARSLTALLGLDLITPASGRGLTGGGILLTDKGAEALTTLRVLQPERTTFRILSDGLTGELTLPGRLQLYSKQELQRRSVHALPPWMTPPHLGSPEIQRVRDLHAQQQRTAGDNSAIYYDLLDVMRITTLYRICTVAVFDPPDEGQVVFRVLDRGIRLTDYERVLAGLFLRQPEVLPFVEEFRGDGDFPSLLDPELADRAADIERQVRDVSIAVAAAEARQEPPPGTASAALVARYTEADLRELESRLRAEYESLRPIEVHEHRPLLEKAFRKARKRVIVVSPFVSPAAVDHALLDLIERALDRNVDVVVGWGMPPSERRSHDRNEDERTKHAVRKLEQLTSRKKKRRVRVVRLGNTHAKVLIKDDEFAVVTSFNWLSFKGDPSRGFRQEIGTYYAIPSKVKETAAMVMAHINAADPSFVEVQLRGEASVDVRDDGSGSTEALGGGGATPRNGGESEDEKMAAALRKLQDRFRKERR